MYIVIVMIIRISISLFVAGSAPVRYKATFRLLRDKNSIEKIIVPKCNIYIHGLLIISGNYNGLWIFNYP